MCAAILVDICKRVGAVCKPSDEGKLKSIRMSKHTNKSHKVVGRKSKLGNSLCKLIDGVPTRQKDFARHALHKQTANRPDVRPVQLGCELIKVKQECQADIRCAVFSSNDDLRSTVPARLHVLGVVRVCRGQRPCKPKVQNADGDV